MEKILRIEEGVFKSNDENYWGSFEGFLIVTDKQTIKVGVSSGQSCCEEAGYFISNDNPDEFVGANLLDVKIVDTCLNVKKIPELDEGDIMFVNLETDRGTFQLTAYNSHNGYYGHDGIVISEQLTATTDL